ncbi:transcription accessory protein [Geminocystis sp. NIES-3708]|uniref:bacteriohemerythrin n=1 Tax=Geminocystis sp. NIES-3708 TaxID=1615909 RepID=UPI0005FC4A14|nr:bacteriohemerythrin [Geminocystis sp. NIES-3708]BAQ61235.1 transcription accessory protein [Geminocystis sp. NIES-3708]
MPIAFWRQEYITGEKIIDMQHQYLFSLINELHDAMIEGKGQEIVGKILDQLVLYTVEHFATEEELMLQYEYPNYLSHKEKHDALKEQVLTLQEKWKNKEEFLTVKVSQFLTDWLIHHIKGEDLNVISHIKNNSYKYQKRS